MNKICVTCDTRLRLKKCSGQEGDFKFCFRPCGSVELIDGNIIPFNNVDELFSYDYFKSFSSLSKIKNLKIEDYSLDNVGLLTCDFGFNEITVPIGYVTKEQE